MRRKAPFFSCLIVAALCLLAMGCHHEAQPARVEGKSSFGMVNMNGKPTIIRSFVSSTASSSRIYRDSFLTINFWINDTDNASEQDPLLTFGFGFIPVSSDSFPIPPGFEPQDSFYAQCTTYAIQYAKRDIGEPCDRYSGAEGFSSWAKILSYDAVTHQVCLQFELHLVAGVYDCQDLPDTLHFTEGEICLEVKPRSR